MEIVRRDWDKENHPDCDYQDLVKIPIIHGEERFALVSIPLLNNVQESVVKEKGGRKWRRVDHKKDKIQNEGDRRKLQAGAGGSKRIWQLREGCEDENTELDVIEKRRRREPVDSFGLTEVGVTILNWPQPNQ